MLNQALESIEDLSVVEAATQLCIVLNLSGPEYGDHTLYDFFQIIFLKMEPISNDCLTPFSILGKRMEKLQGKGIYEVCKALKNDESLERYDRITLLTFLKKRFPRTKPQKIKGPTELDLDVAIVKQRRKNQTL